MSNYPLFYTDLHDIVSRRQTGQALFAMGSLVATPAALRAITAAQSQPLLWLQRHQAGDWGDLCAEDQLANDHALVSGGRLLSAYRVGETRIYVITEAVNDATGRRDSTCILLPSEY